MNCPHCGLPAECVTQRQLYGRPYPKDKWAWRCRPCDASVGCHGHTKEPFGTMAKPAVRRARHCAHAAFDPLWRQGHYPRRTAYELLAEHMAIPFAECHIGLFNEDQCAVVVHFATEHRRAIFQNSFRNSLADAFPSRDSG